MKKVAQTNVAIPATPNSDEFRITALGIGHGDSILLQWRDQGRHWTCLVDGGSSPDRLNQRLDAAKVDKIDLLVLTHLDTDHVGGLLGIAKRRKVTSFWGPALAAFERHLWLFGSRGAAAIKRGRELEDSLKAAKVDICYPLEGYSSTPHDGVCKMSVLSPPARLIRRLLVEEDFLNLFSQEPMPLGWLVGPAPAPPQEEAGFIVNLDAALSRSFVEPADLVDLPPAIVAPPVDMGRLTREWSAKTGLEPEFFGDSVLNNTSLVLYLEVCTGSRSHRVLLPGDQENWTYLLAKNPRGLRADVLKASHHGGRIFLESDPAHDELFSTVQPRVVLFSANGQHKLPRASIRETAIRWGASIACTCSRKAEFITGPPPDNDCCHNIHSCGEAHDVELLLDAMGIRSPLPACHSGIGRQLGPVIQVRQHVVDPSPIVSQLAEHELRRHILWLKSKLHTIHEERAGLAPDLVEGSQTISEEDMATLAREAGRAILVSHLGAVLTQGMKRGALWASPKDRYYRSSLQSYALPEKDDLKVFLQRLAEKDMILFPKPISEIGRDQDSLVNALELEGLASYADATIHFPSVMFREAIWPNVSKAFKSKIWHCFLHRSGAIGFSTQPSSKNLLETIIRPFLKKDDWNNKWLIRVDDKNFPFAMPVLVSGNEKEGKPLDKWARRANVVNWLELEKRMCPEWHWSNLLRLGLKSSRQSYSSDGEQIDSDDLAEHAQGNVGRMAELLAPMVEILW